MKKIADLIEVPEVKTVIQLKDTENSGLRELITRNFLITDEVALFFKSFFSSLLEKEGRGFFVEGNFGSGKSHLLSILSLLLEDPQTWPPLLKQDSEVGKLLEKASKEISRQKYLVIKVSLVEHSNREYLEDIILSEIKETLGKKGLKGPVFHGEKEFVQSIKAILKNQPPPGLKSVLREKGISEEELYSSEDVNFFEEILDRLNLPYRLKFERQETFVTLSKTLQEQGYSGLVFLIDELSEFLRSKADSRRFNEDIRFLQFLGEYGQHHPSWVVATLQEEIEKTGETTPEAFNKIKDRYPFRFRLTGSHIRELISQRLIKLKPGAADEVEDVFSFYQGSFTRWDINREDFLHLYPVHPITIDLLDNLKPLFSQHRGIIDFIHYRLKGDPRRNFPGLLQEDYKTLLTPDLIFDHFQDRIREMVETNPYLEKVFNYYQKEIRKILDEEDQSTGMALIKLLILFKISPVVSKYSVEDLANMVLHQITDLDPEVNYQNIGGILEKLHQNGAYLGKKEGKTTGESIFFIDLEADTNLLLLRKQEYVKNNIFYDDHRLFSQLGLLVKHRSFPLGEILEAPWTLRDFTWQNTPRKGYLLLTSFLDLNKDKLFELEQSLKKEEDFIILLGHSREVEKEKKFLLDSILPELGEENQNSFAFWLPDEIKEPETLREILARMLIYDEYRDDSSANAGEIKEKIKKQLEKDKEKINSLFLDSYFQGEIIGGNGERLINPEEIGLLPWENILEKVAFRILGRRFPLHIKIAPFQNYLNSSQIKLLEEKFLAYGEIDIETAQSTGLSRVIEGFLKPMDLIVKKQRNIISQVKPEKNTLIQALFQELEEEKTEFKPLYWKMRKGPFGIGQNQFNLLILVLLYGGYLTAYSDKRKISLKNFSSAQLPSIKYIGYGEIISEDFQEVLGNCSLLPPRLRNQPFSLPLQQTIWEFLTEKKQELTPLLENLEFKISDLEKKGNLDQFPLEELRKPLNRVGNLLEEIKVSYSAEEGLERFATAYRNMPRIENSLDQVDQIKTFLEEKLGQIQQIRKYIQNPALNIPGDKKYEEIKKIREALGQDLREKSLIFEPGYFEGTRDNYVRFKSEYISFYSEEHRAKLGEERFKPYWEKRNTTSYVVLKLLSEIELISVKNDLVKVDRLLGRALSRSCEVFSPETLEEFPVCTCGFSLGEKVDLPSLQEIQKTIEMGIQEYLENLKTNNNKEKILDYIENMDSAGEKKFSRPLREILQIKAEDKALVRTLEKNLNQQVINRINKALAGDISVVRRDLDELYENIVDRSFSPAKLETIFREWLEGDEKLGKNTFVRVVSREGAGIKEPGEKKELDDFIATDFPELLPYLEKMGEEFFLFLALKNWERKHGVDLKDLQEKNFKRIDLVLNNPPDQKSIVNLLESITARKNLLFEFRDQVDNQLLEKNIFGEILDRFGLDNLERTIQALNNEMSSGLILKEILIMMVKRSSELNRRRGIDNLISPPEAEDDLRKAILLLGRTYLDLEQGLEELQKVEDLIPIEKWASIYSGLPGHLERNYFSLEKLATQTGVKERMPLDLKFRDVARILAASNKKMQNSYRNLNWDGFPQTGDVTEIGSLVLKRYPKLCEKVKAENNFLVFLDGVRRDLWEEMWGEVKKHITIRTIDQGSIIARNPTNTESQIEALRASGYSGNIITPESLHDSKRSNWDIIKFNFVDEKIHTEKKDLNALFEYLIFLTRKTLVPFLKEIPRYSLVLAFSDHGFSINYGFKEQEKYQEERYQHGGITLPEVIVPWSCFYLI